MRAMRTGSKSLRLGSCVAILAMALNALWPLIASARAVGASSLMEICTSRGINTASSDAAADPGSMPVDSSAKHLQVHCALCSFGADNNAAIPAALSHVEPANLNACTMPVDARSAERRDDIHSPAHPRAPPVFS
jgi:hypothetical protein